VTRTMKLNYWTVSLHRTPCQIWNLRLTESHPMMKRLLFPSPGAHSLNGGRYVVGISMKLEPMSFINSNKQNFFIKMEPSRLVLVHRKDTLVSDYLQELTYPNPNDFGLASDGVLIIRQKCAELYESASKVATWSKLSLMATWINAGLVFLVVMIIGSPIFGGIESLISANFNAPAILFMVGSFVFLITLAVAVIDSVCFKRRKLAKLRRIEEYLEIINERNSRVKIVYDVNNPYILSIEFYKYIDVNEAWMTEELEV